MIWSKKYSALYTACLLAVTFAFTGCSKNAPTDLRKYIPTDAIMVGYLDCERLLEHPDIIANHKLATDLGEYFHHLLRSIGFSNPKEHFANFYFFAYNSQHIAIILEGKYVNKVLNNLPSGFAQDDLAGHQAWSFISNPDGRKTHVVLLDENTILLSNNMPPACIAAAVAGAGNNKLLQKIEKADNIACIRSKKLIPCSPYQAEDFQLEIIDTNEHLALSVTITPYRDKDISGLMSELSALPLTQNATISCGKNILLHEPDAVNLLAAVSMNLK